MTAIERTAYPRFKRSFTAKELTEVYTPTPEERFLAHRSTKGTIAEAGFLVLLKTHQRLGRFIPLNEVPFSILDHIIRIVDPTLHVSDLATYDTSGTRQRHIPLIRAARHLQPYGPLARTCALKAMIEAARTKEDVADLINVALEALAKDCFELPPSATLDKAAHHVRAITTRGIYRQVVEKVSLEARTALEQLFVVSPGAYLSPWELLKQEPASPTLMHLRSLIDHLFVISEQRKLLPPHLFAEIAEGKVKQFASEARALDATEMKDLEPNKRLTLAAAFVLTQSAGALDDLAEMFIKRMLAIHQKGKDALVLQLELRGIGSQSSFVMTGLSHDLMMPPKERPGQRVSGCDHLLPEQLPDQAQDLWHGVGDQKAPNPLRDLKCCKLLGPGFGSQAFFPCSAFA